MIRGTIIGQTLKLQTPQIFSGNYNYLQGFFVFSGEWTKATAKFAHFYLDESTAYDIELDEENRFGFVETDQISLGVGKWKFWIDGWGIDADGVANRLITTNQVDIDVKATGTGFPGLNPSLVEQGVISMEAIKREVKNDVKDINESKEAAETAAKAAKEDADRAEKVLDVVHDIEEEVKEVERLASETKQAKEDAEEAAGEAGAFASIAGTAAHNASEYQTLSRKNAENSLLSKTAAETAAINAASSSEAAGNYAQNAGESAQSAATELGKVQAARNQAVTDISNAKTASVGEVNSAKDAAITAIEKAETDAETSIEEKTAEQLERIPEVTAISAEVAALKERVDNVDEVIIDTVEPLQKQADATDEKLDALWKLNEGQTYDIVEQTESGMNDAPKGAKFMSLENVEGKTEQETTNGYQLLDLSKAKTQTMRGVSSEITTDGSIHFFGIFTDNGYGGAVTLEKIQLSGTYTISIDKKIPFYIALSPLNWAATMLITPESTSGTYSVDNEYGNIVVSGNVGETIDITVKIMLEKGSVAHPYEPFTGGIPSPNPDYPQEIHSVEEINVKVTGKNLWNPKINGYLSNNDGSITASLATRSTEFIPTYGKDMSIAAPLYKSDGTDNFYYRIGAYNKNKKWISNIILTSNTAYKLSDYYVLGAVAYVRASAPLYIIDTLQIEYGNATAYEPYTEQTRTITPPRPLNKLGEYKDIADVENGEWEYNIMSKEFNGSESWKSDEVGIRLMLLPNAVDTREAPALDNFAYKRCNIGVMDIRQSTTFYGANILPYQTAIRLRTKAVLDGQTTEDFKESLSVNPVIFLWIPASGATTEPIDPADLAFLRSIELIPADHHITVTDQDGRDVSYLLEYIRSLKEVNS